ncbi:MAG: putative toxin-antitoxin system toxin component, PIN family [Candidatus Aminicenantes bacterium]|nr:putative toxin-antitoxin system toxin component, PIN family [Candidatus Aminicenantes bacterium]
MRVFLDTNVIVSALATRGLCADVFRAVLLRHELIISEILLDAIRRVLRKKLRVPESFVQDLIVILRESSKRAVPSQPAFRLVADTVDNDLVSADLAGRADAFVTGDRQLLRSTAGGAIEIVSPRTFRERLKRD